MELHWSALTRYHDWMGNEKAVPANMIRQWTEAGILGKMDWIKKGSNGKEKEISDGSTPADHLNFKLKGKELYTVSAGGAVPFKWKFTLGLFPFDDEDAMVQGYNIINLWWEKKETPGITESDLLFNTFRKMHTAENTESAFIHPLNNWVALTDPFYGAYKLPVTFSPMFAGIFWATFLGKGQLDLFDTKKLQDISDKRIIYEKDELYIRLTKNISDIINPPEQEQMSQLTEAFRQALQ